MTISIVIPMVPETVNLYARHSRGRHFLSKHASAFKDAVAIMARGKQIRGDAYEVEITVHQGKGGRTDIDNFPKLVLDGLHKCGCIDTDSKVQDLHIHKRRDWAHPRTEVTIKVIDSYE